MSSQGLPSPPATASSPAPSANNVTTSSTILPTPRQNALKPGSSKQINLINYLDAKILGVSRRYEKKFSNSESSTDKDDVPGYTAYEQVAADVDPLIDIVWISGTPTLQIPYLLSLAGMVYSYMRGFPFSFTVFRVVNKIDLAFASLLQTPTTSNAAVSSINRSIVSTTDKVRIKSLIEETRVTAVQVASKSGYSASIQDLSSDSESETETATEAEGDDHDGVDQAEQSIAMNLSKVYKRTMEILGDSLVSSVQQPR